jgi:hypothetical protein
MHLNESIMIALPEDGRITWQNGIVVGRTLEAEPTYDVRLEGGKIIASVPARQLRMVETAVSFIVDHYPTKLKTAS